MRAKRSEAKRTNFKCPRQRVTFSRAASDKTWPRFNRYDAAGRRRSASPLHALLSFAVARGAPMLLADKLDLQNKLKLNMLQVRAVLICLLFFRSKLTPPLVVCAAD